MRRTVGLIFIGLGAFLLTLSPLVRFYAAHQLIAAPTDPYTKTYLQADNATYFDAGNLKLKQGVTLLATNTTRGDVRASSDKIAVYDSFTSVTDATNGTPVDYQQQRIAFDRRTALRTNCCGASVANDTSVKQSGLGVVWPVGDVRKKTYQYFDVTTKRAWPMRFDGVDKVQGIKTYRFTQDIPQTKIGEVPDVPGTLLGLDKEAGNITADRYSGGTTIIWVDPRTGAVVNQEQRVHSSLRSPDGEGELTVADADLKMQPQSQKELVKLSSDNAGLITLVKTWVPLIALIVGAALLIAGAVLFLFGGARGRRGDRGAEII